MRRPRINGQVILRQASTRANFRSLGDFGSFGRASHNPRKLPKSWRLRKFWQGVSARSTAGERFLGGLVEPAEKILLRVVHVNPPDHAIMAPAAQFGTGDVPFVGFVIDRRAALGFVEALAGHVLLALRIEGGIGFLG